MHVYKKIEIYMNVGLHKELVQQLIFKMALHIIFLIRMMSKNTYLKKIIIWTFLCTSEPRAP